MKNLLFRSFFLVAMFLYQQGFSQDDNYVSWKNYKGETVINFFKTVPNLVDSDHIVPVPTALIGELPNKFKYYIVKNNSSPGKIYIKLLLKVGLGNQEPGQVQVAHLLEHAVFRGTTSFPGDSLHKYLRTKGIELGGDFGASTGYNNTQYDLNIPTGDTGLLKNSLLVMRERLNGGLLLTDEGIETEKRIVQEEIMLRSSPEFDISNKIVFGLYASSCVCDRGFCINTKDQIDGVGKVASEEVRKFYKDWYRPDLAGIIVMGDIDANVMEKRIHDFFADIEMPTTIKYNEPCKLAHDRENRYVVQSSSFNKPLELTIYFKQAGKPKRTYKDFKTAIIGQLYDQITESRKANRSGEIKDDNFSCNSRYYEQVLPFGASDISGVKFRGNGVTLANVTDFEIGLKRGLRAMEQVRRYGFKQAELELAKEQILKKWNKVEFYSNSNYQLRAFCNHFIYDEAVPAPDYHYELVARIVKELSLAEVNEAVKGWLNSPYIDITILYPEKFANYIPTEQTFRGWMKKVKDEPLKDFVPAPKKVINFNATNKIPPAKAYQKKQIVGVDVTELKLSNGATVLLKAGPSDGILFQAISKGGAVVYNRERFYNALLAGEIVNNTGIGELNPTELRNYFEDNVGMGIRAIVKEREEGIEGGTSEAKLEEFLQVVYLYFTKPNQNEKLAKQFIDRIKKSAGNERINMSDRLSQLRNFGTTPWYLPSNEAWDQIKPKDSYQIYKERFANAGDFTFVISGIKDVDAAIPLLVKYVGALPDFGKREKVIPWSVPEFKGGTVETTSSNGLVAGNDIVYVYYAGAYKYDEKSTFVFDVLSKVLGEILSQRVRVKEGGTYSVFSENTTAKTSTGIFHQVINFQCSSDRRDSLLKALFEEIELLKMKGPTEKVFEHAVTQVLNANDISGMDAFQWRDYLVDQFRNDLPLTAILERSNIIKSITVKDIQNAAEKYLSEKYLYVNIVKPVEGK